MKFTDDREKIDYLTVLQFRLDQLDTQINELMNERDRLVESFIEASKYEIN